MLVQYSWYNLSVSWPGIRYVELDIKNVFLHFILLGYKINFYLKFLSFEAINLSFCPRKTTRCVHGN